LWFSDSGV